ncbi:sulfatase-like hydrolase/transferase [Winogradskyella echinorum]|uniref:Sulfatase-like hydrolase/transferase n=1 Tax=Winogradskyella echinorum TaxID=538189 RepID=A0ABR6XZU0_9FLAO|nr:sulfatase-like hydrolase/transferase [Winogradskyella echinorum]MBC3846007.1 sulfatase-like hydrolase/transferase [Winogradskyella echinorum]MBC5750355.1 sulfatase-like hydrolase/transferase [Winogradskyella echinorum]
MKQFLIFTFSLLLISCNSKKEKTEETTVNEKPNILLIVVDDQGYSDFTPFEAHDKTVSTPHIDRLGKSGVVFTQAYVTAPVCSPSRAGILTGKNQFRWDKPASWGPGLPDDVKTLPEYLKEVGYETARIGKNDLGRNFHKNDVREYPLNHGYDEFLGFSAHAHDYWLNSQTIKDRTPDPYGTSALLGPLMHNMGEKSYEEGYLTDIFTDESIKFIKRKRDKPFFLTLSYNAVHHLIHEVPKKYLDKYNVKEIPNYNPDSLLTYSHHKPGSYSAYYDKYSRVGAINTDDLRKYYLANLNCLDDNIGRLLDALKETNLDKNTLIVFISDNGGSPLTGSNNSPLTGGKYSLWEGGIRVPMAVSWPGNVNKGKVETRYVSATDILPTIVKAAGATLTDKDIDGINIFEPENDRLLVWKWQKTWAVRKGNWKLTNAKENHWKSEPSAQYIAPIRDDLTLKLFNIEEDPGERNDLASIHPEIVRDLEAAFKNWCESNIK